MRYLLVSLILLSGCGGQIEPKITFQKFQIPEGEVIELQNIGYVEHSCSDDNWVNKVTEYCQTINSKVEIGKTYREYKCQTQFKCVGK